MKVEIGESLVYSWLRHIKQCEIVQLNWKTSPIWEGSVSIEELQKLMDKSSELVGEPFKGTKRVEQLLKQAEIDSIGINLSKNKVYAVDVAFHENGLNYGSTEKTANNIAKKVLRTLFILKHHFGNISKQKILFISPKIGRSYEEPIQIKLQQVREFISSENLNCSVEVISNNDFHKNIIIPITSLSKNVADTSELFLRSIQLLDMHKKNTNNTEFTTKKSYTPDVESEIKKVHKKVPKWFKKPAQRNSTILLRYMELRREKPSVTVRQLEKACSNIKNFYNSYNQMKCIAENNNAKVFQENDGVIMLWDEVDKFIINEYNQYLSLTSSSRGQTNSAFDCN